MTILHAVCHNCRTWSGGSIDLKSTSQPMIYAFGPGDVLQSNSLSADLRRHARYGFFSMDMLAATGPGGVPPKTSVINGVSMRSPIIKDHDRASLAHAILGCVALFVLWPINVVLAGFIKNIRIHIGCSVLIIIFLIISYSLGISKSFEYNRVRLPHPLPFPQPNLKIHQTNIPPSPKPSPPPTKSSPSSPSSPPSPSASCPSPLSPASTPPSPVYTPPSPQPPSSCSS